MNAAIGPVGASLIAGVILCSITGAANGNVLTAPRVFFAMARDGVFFRRFADLHPRLLTPHVSILATGAWAAVLSVTGTFEQLATYVVFGQWIFFGLTVGAVMILRATRPDLPRPYRTWGYPVTPVVFILAALYISVSTLVTQPRQRGRRAGASSWPACRPTCTGGGAARRTPPDAALGDPRHRRRPVDGRRRRVARGERVATGRGARARCSGCRSTSACSSS